MITKKLSLTEQNSIIVCSSISVMCHSHGFCRYYYLSKIYWITYEIQHIKVFYVKNILTGGNCESFST